MYLDTYVPEIKLLFVYVRLCITSYLYFLISGKYRLMILLHRYWRQSINTYSKYFKGYEDEVTNKMLIESRNENVSIIIVGCNE
jgi:hypothetical protein